jgi:hypothetical protein
VPAARLQVSKEDPSVRIALRTSGGRGEYEIAGSQGEYAVADVLNRQIFLELFPGEPVATQNWVTRIQGKPRIRLRATAARHLYLTLADALLMPKPKRELGATPAGPLQLTENNYSVSSIQFHIVDLASDRLTIQPTNLILENSEGNRARIDVLERLRIVVDLWSAASRRAGELAASLSEHRDRLRAMDLAGLRAVANTIRTRLDSNDPLREILREFSLLDQYTYWMGVHRNDLAQFEVENESTTVAEAGYQRICQWRLQAARGSQATKFARDVKEAYRNRCLFSGNFLPRSELIPAPGVDAAHILPWAEHGINDVRNGICLDKLCHWAFDVGALVLDFTEEEGFRLRLSQHARRAHELGRLDVGYLGSLEGRIPIERLPTDRRLWPAPEYVQRYNQALTRAVR